MSALATSTPIGDHALISDCRSTALVDTTGSIDWLCWPRVDSPSVFGRIPDPSAGHGSIRPADDAVVARRYVARTMVLETTFARRAARSSSRMRSSRARRARPRARAPGTGSPRAPRGVTTGEVDVEFELAPRSEYDLITPVSVPVDGGLRLHGGPDVLVL